jgi:hypothetical protein
VVATLLGWPVDGQVPVSTPTARLVPAPPYVLPGRVDANTPVMWSLVSGRWEMAAVTSWGGIASQSVGSRLEDLSAAAPVVVRDHPGYGVWLESILEDDAGTWYGYYHHEVPAFECGRLDLQVPSIRALRSVDRGRTWDDLGTVVEAPASSHACRSANKFVLGGVGDVSALVDHDRRYLYLYFSQYAEDVRDQGIGVARLAWADRDAPSGKAAVWRTGVWMPPRANGLTASGEVRWEHPVGTPLVRATRSWHDAHGSADAYWGPSIHWNTYLERWVMLANRARNQQFDQDGLYLSYSTTLSDPAAWTPPKKLVNGGQWYPQVIGIEPGAGTDKRAGQRARFFMTGRSAFYLDFTR